MMDGIGSQPHACDCMSHGDLAPEVANNMAGSSITSTSTHSAAIRYAVDPHPNHSGECVERFGFGTLVLPFTSEDL